MIEINNLTKKFDEHLAVDRLTLTIEQGEVFGFLGPNGAGKTTTIRMLTSLIQPTSGTARVLGFEIGQDDQEIRRNVGILTETPGLYDRLSAWRNLLIYAKLYEVEDPAEQAEKYLKWLGLWSRKDDSAGTFSKGMRQKLAIARALIHEPSVLFLDEPSAGLDPESAKLVRDFIEELSEAGRTIFICTHNLDEADRLCDRIAVFNKQLRVVDTPDGLRKQIYGRKVVYHFAHEGSDFVEIVEKSPYVKEVETIDNKIVLSLDEPELHNPEIIRALVAAGAQIQFVGEVRHSLEDIYLQLVD
jgi:ABC-2 type transport system ATP-binding protein